MTPAPATIDGDAMDRWGARHTWLERRRAPLVAGHDRTEHALVDVRMLGPAAATSVDGGAALTGKVAVLLARLAVEDGAVLGRGRLLADVWPTGSGHPGPLRVAVNRARVVLGSQVVVTEGSGYRIGPHTSDVRRAEQQLTAARDRTRSLAERIESYERALAQWSGPFLEGVEVGMWVHAERVRLAELRELSVDERFELLLAAGGHQRVLSELHAAALAAPTREHRVWLLVLALYRCGRQADALSTIHVWGRRLRAELGLEPGPALRELEQRILHHDQSLDLPPPLSG